MLIGLLLGLAAADAGAGQAVIEEARFVLAGPSQWTVHATVRHGDTGWEHYADAWRVVDEHGRPIGVRTLYHPHVGEQPFTRSLSGLVLPRGTAVVYVEVHDTVHGWSADRVRVDLTEAQGPRFTVER